MEDPAIIQANIQRYQEIVEFSPDQETRERARKLLAEAREALAQGQKRDDSER